jgi:hypothetical protein
MDECYRCGYDLRGVANDRACPECGLLAQRSRRVTDELHDTRPRWLRSLSLGVILVLLAMAAPVAGPLLLVLLFDFLNPQLWSPHIDVAGFDFAALALLLGVILLTRPEGYPPADEADRRLRILLRLAAMVPVLAVVYAHLEIERASLSLGPGQPDSPGIQGVLLSVLCAPLPLLLFLRLRGLAKRARSAHLAEHCMIVGIGASASILYVTAAVFLLSHPERFGLGTTWDIRSNVAMVIQLVLGVAFGLFVLWSLYLLVRFAVAFWFAARKLRRKWARDDRSISADTGSISH